MKVHVAGDYSSRRVEIRKLLSEIEGRWEFYNDCGIHEDTADDGIVLGDIRDLMDVVCELIEDNEILETEVTMWKGEALSP